MKSVIVGLTGQSGAGKTTVSDIFKEAGFGIINCDIISREVTVAGSECNKELAMYFPRCFNKKLKLSRKAMAATVFTSKTKLELLDRVIYKYIFAEIEKEINRLSENFDYIILDAPTLFEANADNICDYIVGVTAPRELRLNRIIARDGISEEMAMKRFSSQHTETFFIDHCDYIIENDERKHSLQHKTEEVIHNIISKGKRNGSS